MSVAESPRAAIEAHGLGKVYRRMAAGFRLRTLKSALLEGSLTRGLSPEETVVALEGVDLAVEHGEAFGVIGANGSGKSTLLKLCSGLLKPSAGSLEVRGRVAALIELGAGFHPEISGRENVFINGAVLGLTRRQIEERFDRIVEFSGLADFIEEPVKNYSSGMYVRLGFAVAIHSDPDVLLVDEVLAVGDEAFAHRCLARIDEHLAAGKTLLVVSHSLDLVERLCGRVLWLERGRPQGVGPARQMIDAYRQRVAEEEGRLHQQEKDQALEANDVAEVLRWGSRQAEIHEARLIVDGVERYQVPSGARVAIEIDAVAHETMSDFVFGVAISTPRGVECWGTNTDLDGLAPCRLQGQATAVVECPDLSLAAGEYLVDVAVHSRNGAPYDYRRRIFGFTVTTRRPSAGVYAPDHFWSFRGGARFAADREDEQS